MCVYLYVYVRIVVYICAYICWYVYLYIYIYIYISIINIYITMYIWYIWSTFYHYGLFYLAFQQQLKSNFEHPNVFCFLCLKNLQTVNNVMR